jgi:hypothetical protein
MHREIITCIGKLLLRSSISYFIWQDLIDNLYIYISIFYGWLRIYIELENVKCIRHPYGQTPNTFRSEKLR